MGYARHLRLAWRLAWPVLLLVASLGAVHAQTATEGEAERRLPRFCAYRAELRSLPNPHRALAGTITGRDTIVCPFAASAESSMIYAPRPKAGCATGDLGDIPVSAVSDIDAVSATRAEQCRANRDAWPGAAGKTGPAYEISYSSPTDGSDPSGASVDPTNRILNSGAPIDFVSSGFSGTVSPKGKVTISPEASICLQMKPDAGMDAMTYLRLIGVDLPPGAAQKQTSSCSQSHFEDDEAMGREGTFTLWLGPTADTPSRRVFDQEVAELLRSAGVTTRHRRFVRNGYETLVSTRDGVTLGLIGGRRQVMVDLRVLSPGACEVIYALADHERLAVGMNLDTEAVLTPPGVTPSEADSRPQVTTAGAADLCMLLAPSFRYWHEHAPKFPTDLRDLDNRRMGLGD